MTIEEKRERYKKMNQSIQTGQTLFVGSSLMEMFPVEKLLKEAGYEGIVYNRGIGGYVIDDLRDSLEECVLALEPRRIFINIGTNDLTRAEWTIEDIMKNYDALIAEMKEKLPNAKFYFMAYYPINQDAADESMKEALRIRTNEKICLANEEVKKLAEKHHAAYIDVNDALKDEQGRLKAEYTIEGMHINEDGYRAIIPALLKFVEEETE